MLILSRRLDEEVVVTTPSGEQIVVCVTDFQGLSGDDPQVKLGFSCDRAIQVHRREVHEAIKRTR